MKILILSDTFPTYNDFKQIDWNLANGFRSKGHQVFVLTVTRDRDDEKFGECVNGICIYRIFCEINNGFFSSCSSLYNRRLVRRIKRIIKSVKPDVVHAHKVNRCLSYHSLRIARKYSKAVFITAHDVSSFENKKIKALVSKYPELNDNIVPKRNFFINCIVACRKVFIPLRQVDVLKYYLRGVDRIFTVSDNLKNILIQNNISNVNVVYNGVRSQEWALNKEGDKDDFIKSIYKGTCLKNKKIIAYIGALSRAKGFGKLCSAMEYVGNDLDDVVLLIVGSDKGSGYSDEIKKYLNKRNISFLFLGYVDVLKMRKIYSISDLVVTFSILNPVSMVALEAMASGVPVLWGCFSGASEIEEKYKKLGYVHNLCDPREIAMKIIDILKNDSIRLSLAKEGRKRLKDKFTLEKQVNRYLYYFEKELGGK